MTKKIGVQYDHLKIPIVGLVAQNNSGAPSSPANGQLYYDTGTNRLMVRENAAWVLASQTGTLLTSQRGAASGVASLDGSTKIPIAEIPTGTTGSTVPFGNDARFTDQRVPTDGSVTGGTAGAGVKIAAATITAANIANATITDTQIAAANKDGVAGTASLRTLGTGAQQALAGNTTLNNITLANGTLNMNSQKITGLAAPTVSSDAVRLADLQAAQAGIDNKPSVRLVATTNRATTGLAAIDGVTPVAGERILLTANTTASENGPWIAAAGAWSRPAGETVTAQSFWMVEEGTTYGGSQWKVNTPDPITLGVTNLTINQWGASGTVYTGTTNRITVTGGTIDIAATYVGQTSITTLGTVTTGTWTATDIAVADGGTGASNAAGAKTNLGFMTRYAVDLGALTAGVAATITHSLNTLDVIVAYYDKATGEQIDLLTDLASVNTVEVTADIAYSAAAIRAVVIG